MASNQRAKDACMRLCEYVADNHIDDKSLLILVLEVTAAVNGKTLTKEQIEEIAGCQVTFTTSKGSSPPQKKSETGFSPSDVAKVTLDVTS